MTFCYGLLRMGVPVFDHRVGLRLRQFCTDTGCILEDLLGAMDDADGWRESENSVLSVQFDDELIIRLYIFLILE